MKRSELAAACALDALAGDPPGLLHPVELIGAAIAAIDRRRAARPPARELVDGALATAAIAGASALGAHLLARCGGGPRIVLAASALAARSLLDAVGRVRMALDAGDLSAARSALRPIVGRDVDELDAAEIARGALETLAESLGDGVAAPLAALAVGGCSAAFAFKAISTLDSLIGHREAPYTWFGRVAARCDDIANFVPARLATLAVALAADILGANGANALRVAFADASGHRSPNAGWPEAALAGALGVRLGGTNRYDGTPVAGAIFNKAGRAPAADDVGRGMCIVALAALLLGAGAVAVARP